jgi:glycosyltransferase involved in cell wall biosynthesis
MESITQDWPNLLLLSDEGPQMSTAGGILLFRLLQGYPPERLHVIERRVEKERERLSCQYDSLVVPWGRFEHSRFHRWKRSLRAYGLVPPVSLRKVNALLGNFRPQVVLCVMQHAAYYDTAWRFARSRKLPLIVIVHDVNEQFEPVLPFALKAMRRRDGAFYRYASSRLCVSPEMEALCAQLYGVKGDVQYPNRSEELQPRPFLESRKLRRDGVLTIGFVGNLNYGYGEGLLQLLPAFRATKTRLVLFSNPPGGKAAPLLEANDCCEFRGFAPAKDAWQSIQADCDAVILPYPNADAHMERLYRHHFPSKLSEYLALGMPVIITGPDYATGVQWGFKHPDAAVTHIITDIAGLVSALSRLYQEPDFRQRLAERATQEGITEFDPTQIKARFLNIIREHAQRSNSNEPVTGWHK